MSYFEIEDNGPGISGLEKIFEAFFTSMKEGLGVGLSHTDEPWLPNRSEPVHAFGSACRFGSIVIACRWV